VKILIAEDDNDIRAVLELAVASLGYDVCSARDGREAWQLFQAEGADVIISDWLMPGLEGTELCRLVRSAEDVPYVYFVILTALDSEEHMLQGMQAGADDYLNKPFTIGALQARLVAAERVTALHRALDQRDAERALALSRRAALLRVARRFAAEADPDTLLQDLIVEAVALVQGEVGTVYRWDEGQQRLVLVATSSPGEPSGLPLPLGESAVGLAAERREAVLISGPGDGAAEPAASEVAIPLLHEGRLVGSLSVRTSRAGLAFSDEDVESLELLAGIAAAAEVGLERAQLLAVTLAARELAHLLNNDLAVPVGALELLAEDGALPPRLRDIVDQGRIGLNDAADHVFRLQQLIRFETKKTPIGPALDLDRSARQASRRPPR
jgi:CheY-like chemotaxis protein/putative methionine-R-sulfoxide reductase with GAF domain